MSLLWLGAQFSQERQNYAPNCRLGLKRHRKPYNSTEVDAGSGKIGETKNVQRHQIDIYLIQNMQGRNLASSSLRELLQHLVKVQSVTRYAAGSEWVVSGEWYLAGGGLGRQHGY